MIKIVRDSKLISGHLPVFASERYLKSASKDYGWFVSSQFILPFFVVRRALFKHIVFTTQTIYRDLSATIAQERKFLSSVIAESRKLKSDFISQPKTNALFNVYPEGSIHIEWGSYRVDLSKSDEELFAELHSHHRRVVRKAKRDSVHIHSGPEFIRDCHELIQWTMDRQHKPCVTLEQLEAYQENLGEGVSFYLARHGGINHACAVLIWDSSSSYYIHGGSRLRPHNGAASLLHWTAMLDMKKKGVETYDFVGGRINPVQGSKQESIQKFKSRFGASFKKGYLWKYPIKPWKYSLYQALYHMGDMAKGCRYSEDIIDNEIRTSHLNGRSEC